METIDKYLKSIKWWLPKAEREDILNELSENIVSQIEANEAELGRPLNQTEIETILKRHGHPMALAGRYYSERKDFVFSRWIIGPTFLPLYLKVLSFTTVIGFSMLMLVTLGGLMSSSFDFTLMDGLRAFLIQMVAQLTIVTGVFLWIESYLTKNPNAWDVNDPDNLNLISPRQTQVFEAVVQIVVYSIFGLGINTVLNGDNQVPILRPIWEQTYLPIMFVVIAEVIVGFLTLLRPQWIRLHLLVNISGGVAALIVLHLLLTAKDWFVVENSRLANSINQHFVYWLIVSGVIVLVLLIRDIFRLVRHVTVSNAVE
jgi:hypothetical protein